MTWKLRDGGAILHTTVFL